MQASPRATGTKEVVMRSWPDVLGEQALTRAARSESGLGADLLSQPGRVRAGPVVSHGANSLQVHFLREEILGKCLFAFRISERPLQGRIHKGNERLLEKARKQILP